MTALKTVLEKQWELYENEAKWSRHQELEIEEMEETIAERYKGLPKKTIAVSCRICVRVKVATISALVCVACGRNTCTRCGKQDQGLWRCILCKKKREYAMSSGTWYHGVEPLQRSDVQDMLNRIADELVRRREQAMCGRRDERTVQELTPATNDAQLRSPPTIACVHNAKEMKLKQTEDGDDDVFEDDNEGTDKYLNFPLPEDGNGMTLAVRSVTHSDFGSVTTVDPCSSSDDDIFMQGREGELRDASGVNQETSKTFDEQQQNDRMQSRKKPVIAPPHHKYTPMIQKVILWKDLQVSSDASGLAFGIKIVGGKMCPGGFMGASITKVTNSYLAEQKVFEGDQILEWNRISMVDVTFEEAKTIADDSPEKVAVIIYHNPTCPPVRTRLPSVERISQAIREKRKMYESIKCSSQRSLLQLMIENDSFFAQGDGGVKKEPSRGKIQLNLWHDPHGKNIVVQVVKARGLSLQDTPNQELPSCYVLLNLLPNRGISGQFRTNTDPETVNPHWNLSFVFTNITEDELSNRTLELTLWSENLRRHSFLGEVMVQMTPEVLQRGTQWFDIIEPDENCIPLPIPMPRRHTVSSCDSLPCVEEPGHGKTFWWNNDTKVKKYSYPGLPRSVSAYNLSNCRLQVRDSASDGIGMHHKRRRRTEAIVTINNLRLTAETDGQERRTELFRGCLKRYSGMPGYFSAPTTPHISTSTKDIRREWSLMSFGDRLHVPASPFGAPPPVLSLDVLKQNQRSNRTEGALESDKWRSGTDEQEYLGRERTFTTSSDTILRGPQVSPGSCTEKNVQQENKDGKTKGTTKARKKRPSNLRIRLSRLTEKEGRLGESVEKRSRRIARNNGMPGYFSAPTTPHICTSTEDIRRKGSLMSFGDRLHVPASPFAAPPPVLFLEALKQKQRSNRTEEALESDERRPGTDEQDVEYEEQHTGNLPLITIDSVTSIAAPSESRKSGETESGDDQQSHDEHSPEETTNEKKGPVTMLRRYSRGVLQRTKKIPSEECLFGNEPVRGVVGPGQFRRASFTAEDLGYIRIGLLASHDVLEVEIIRAVAVPCPGDRLPDTYVKTYLIKDQVRLEKRKTSLIRQNANPVYNCRMKYPGFDLYNKELLVSVWCKQGIFGRKILLGEVTIALGSLNLACKQTTWYKLYVECPLSDL